MLEINKIYNEDCYKGIKKIPDNSIDCICTDSPYLIGSNKGEISDNSIGSNREYLKNVTHISNGFDFSILEDFKRVLKNMNLIIFGSKFQIKPYLDWIYENEYTWELIVWHKNNPTPLINSSYLPGCEYIFHIWKNRKLGGNYHTKSKVISTNVIKNEFNHPTVKPIEVIIPLLINATDENDIVLDPFIGTGTTALACLDLNRQYIGFELDENYFKIAQNRIKGHELLANGLLDLETIKIENNEEKEEQLKNRNVLIKGKKETKETGLF